MLEDFFKITNMRQFSLRSLLFNIVLEELDGAARQEIKDIEIRREEIKPPFEDDRIICFVNSKDKILISASKGKLYTKLIYESYSYFFTSAKISLKYSYSQSSIIAKNIKNTND